MLGLGNVAAFLVLMVVGIALILLGAMAWERHYHKHDAMPMGPGDYGENDTPEDNDR